MFWLVTVDVGVDGRLLFFVDVYFAGIVFGDF